MTRKNKKGNLTEKLDGMGGKWKRIITGKGTFENPHFSADHHYA